MSSSVAIKRAVRERDNQRCTACAMTAREHKRRYGRTLEVHRTEAGPYRLDKCKTLCRLCHKARHSFKCKIRKRDGYVCTECGITNREHLRVCHEHLSVHSDRAVQRGDSDLAGQCAEPELKRLGMKQCYTLCDFCHLAKHSISAEVLRRDKFMCRKCKKRPRNWRRWYQALTVHRLSGCFDERLRESGDASEFVTLCHSCHDLAHPDRFGEYVRLGFECDLPEIVAKHPNAFQITVPVTRSEQLGAYKQYLRVVNFFIDCFQTDGLPKEAELGASLLSLPKTSLPDPVRREAAIEAMRQISSGVTTLQNIRESTPMTQAQRDVLLLKKQNALIRSIKKRNLKPTVWLSKWHGSTSVMRSAEI